MGEGEEDMEMDWRWTGDGLWEMGDPTAEAGHLQFARDVTYAGRRTQVKIGTGRLFMQCRDRASLDVECLSSFLLSIT
ncbi:hypothetical protein N7455_004199 [Penicillium solitum]|uniref:uncharacterized protein n=1 Tax=Penicillium solitum TaxID=60172 RepID=UPI0017BCC5A6|nr:hypothetical protein HAV15_003862 [Penicillium sp. str. \